jgi:tRNA 2-selenouridine synthase
MLIDQLQGLKRYHGAKLLEHWAGLIEHGEFSTFVGELLTIHYDPSYLRATGKHFTLLDKAQRIPVEDLSNNALLKLAATL